MEGVKRGGDRQALHERIRVLSMKAGENVKVFGLENNLIELIKNDETFKDIRDEIDKVLCADKYVGRAPSQVVEFISQYIDPILEKNKELLGIKAQISV